MDTCGPGVIRVVSTGKQCGIAEGDIRFHFSWYRQVSSHHHDGSTSGMHSWKRARCPVVNGWTPQELLAPRSLLFFTQDWSLYILGHPRPSNHCKEDSITSGRVARSRRPRTTSRHLIAFYPSVDDARSRLQSSARYLVCRYLLFAFWSFWSPRTNIR